MRQSIGWMASASVTAIAIAIAGLNATSAAAQETQKETPAALEEIVVTAQKASVNLQDTPVAVALVTGDDLTAAPTSGLQQALRNMPAVQVTQQGNIGLNVVVRGVGGPPLGGQAGISTLYDGIFSAHPIYGRVGFYDTARLEVLLGPQGTLYGKNAEGGVFNIISNDPTFTKEAFASVGVGSRNLVNVQAMGNVALSDKAALRIAAASTDQDGYLSNGQNDNRSRGARAKLLLKPSDGVSVLLAGEYASLNGKGSSTVPQFIEKSSDTAYDVTYPSTQYYRQDAYRVWANLQADVGFGQLTIMPAYARMDEAEQLTYNSFTALMDGKGFSGEKSLEARLSSKPGARITWIVGGYVYDSRENSPGDFFQTKLSPMGDIVKSNTVADVTLRTLDSLGVFAQATVPLTGAFRIIAGARYSQDKGTFFNDGGNTTAADQSAKWDHTDYRLGVQYDVSDHSQVYASIATGYRPGGFSVAAPRGGSYQTYAIESVKSYEIGSKNQFLDNRLRVNLSAYYYDYSGYQQTFFQSCRFSFAPADLRPVCPTDAIPFYPTIDNIGAVRVQGAELSSQLKLTARDLISFNAAYTDSKIKSAALIGIPAAQVQGSVLPNSPEWNLSGGYTHDFLLSSGTLTPEISANYQTDTILALPADAYNTQRAVLRLEASVTYLSDEGWRLSVWGRNLTNEVVKFSAQGPNLFLGPPREMGATISARF